MMKKALKNKSGFTIVEFMIATMVFTIVLLICAYAITHVGRMYYKGIIIGRTQDASRRVVEEISQTIQFSAGANDPSIFKQENSRTENGILIQSYCLNKTKYSYTLGHSLGTAAGQSRHLLWRDVDTDGTCFPTDITQAGLTGGEELLGEGMRLPHFEIDESNGLWSIDIRVTYGDDPELYEVTPGQDFLYCKGASAGGQFCAVSAFSSSVMRRL